MTNVDDNSDNAEQIKYWNAKAGAIWVAQQAHLDHLLAPLSEAGLAAAKFAANESALDVGCGCGDTSIALGASQSSGSVTGVDISEPMLAHAQVRADAMSNVSFEQADAAIAEFSNQYNLVFSRFGVMFFADPEAAFKNLRKALKPNGRMVFVCWQPPSENPWMSLAGKAVQPFMPPAATAPNPHAPGPFAFSDPAHVLAILSNAGFANVQIESFNTPLHIADNLDDALYFQTQIGPAANAVVTLEGAEKDQALNAVKEMFRPHMTSEGLDLEAAVWIVSAENQV
jgi:ubiquinone/menaquinone biosynthesis C-methylase UbiE